MNESSRILLKFQTLHVPNCEENYLDVYDGNKGSTLLARFCGENATSGAKVKSMTNYLYIIFKSGNNMDESTDDLPTSLRFHAEYEVLQEGI